MLQLEFIDNPYKAFAFMAVLSFGSVPALFYVARIINKFDWETETKRALHTFFVFVLVFALVFVTRTFVPSSAMCEMVMKKEYCENEKYNKK